MSKTTRRIKNRILVVAMIASVGVLGLKSTFVSPANQLQPYADGELHAVNNTQPAGKDCPKRTKAKQKAENVSVFKWLFSDHKASNFHFIDVLELFK